MRLITTNRIILILLLGLLSLSLKGQENVVIHELNQNLDRWLGRTVEITGYLYVDEDNDRIEVWETSGDLMVNYRFNWDYHVELVKGSYLPDDINDIQGALVVVTGSVGKVDYIYEFLGDGLEVGLLTVNNFEIKKKKMLFPKENVDDVGSIDIMAANCDSCKFAIFFCGYRQADFWNDIKQKYNYKKDKHKVCPDHIIVLYKGGSHNTGDIPNGTTDSSGNMTSGGAFECSRANLAKAFEYVKNKMKALNCEPGEFQFHSTGHGGGYQGRNGQKPGHPDSLATGISGGRLDDDGDEVNNRTNENDVIFWSRGRYDLDGDGTPDIRVRMVPDPRDTTKRIKQVQQDKDGDGTFETLIGHDFNGDGRVSKADSAWTAPDLNKNGRTDEVGWEDTMQISGGEVVTDDELRRLFQGLIDSTGLNKQNSRAELAQCFSGSFMDDLRSVTTVSTSACARDEVSWSYRGAHGYNIYEKYFIDSLAAGRTWTDAHRMATDSANARLARERKSQHGQVYDNSTVCIEVKGPYKKGNQICIWIRNICGKTMAVNPFINTYNFGIASPRLARQDWRNTVLKNGEFREFCINLPSDSGRYCFLGGISYSNDGFQYESKWLNNIQVEARIGTNTVPITFEVGGDDESNVEFVFLNFDPTTLPPGWDLILSQQEVQIIDNKPVLVEAQIIIPPDAKIGDVGHFRIDGWTESPTEPFVGYVAGDIVIVEEINELQLALPEGWSLSSLNGLPDNPNVHDLIPDATILFGFNQSDGYVPLEMFSPPMGFWLHLPQAGEYRYPGTNLFNYVIEIPEGWSIIGGLTEKTGQPITEGDCKIQAMFCFDPLSGYYPCEGIEPGTSAWINMSSPCTISVIPTTNIMKTSAKASLWETTLNAKGETAGLGITVSKAIVGADKSTAETIPAPPPPPDYTTDIKVYQLDNNGKPQVPALYKAIQVDINKSDTLRWVVEVDPNGNDPFVSRKSVVSWSSGDLNTGDPNQKWLMVPGIISEGIGSKQIDMQAVDNMEVTGISPEFFTMITFYLSPNSVEENNVENDIVSIKSIVPNPFNDNVDIGLSLSVDAEISLTVFDIFGRVIWTHNAGILNSGYQVIEWKGLNTFGTEVVTGNYFVRVSAKTGRGVFCAVKTLNKIK